jgi:hypothetical protein
VTNELFFALTIFLLFFGIPTIFFAFQRRKVFPIVIVSLVFLASGIWGFTRIMTDSPPRNDPVLEAHGIYVPMYTTPTAIDTLGKIFVFFSSIGLVVAGGFGTILSITRSERNRQRKEMRGFHHRPCA